MPLDGRDASQLADMRRFASRVDAFVRGHTIDDFDPDSELRFAVERGIEIIGEAASRVSGPLRGEHPEIAWGQIIGMRNVLAHGYATVDGVVLWRIATTDVPELVQQIDRILQADLENGAIS
jgi:uncharacterized protein with HEPN domain